MKKFKTCKSQFKPILYKSKEKLSLESTMKLMSRLVNCNYSLLIPLVFKFKFLLVKSNNPKSHMEDMSEVDKAVEFIINTSLI